jgi:hypothetical protein
MIAGSRSLVTMNARSIDFAPSVAKKGMLAVVRKLNRFLPKRPNYVPGTGEISSQRWLPDFDLQDVTSTNSGL